MSTARKVLRGAAWTYGAQALTVMVQFAYAGVTSRLVDEAGFGAYAVALSASGLAGLLATSGLGQAVGRMRELDEERIQALLTYALVVGGIAAALVLVSAAGWAALWNTPASVPVTQFAAVTTLASPAFGVATALHRRLGRFRQLSIATVVCNSSGMVVGTVCVVVWRSSVALLVSTTVAQLLLLAYSVVAAPLNLRRLRSPRLVKADISYSWRLMLTSVASFVNGNIVKLSVSRSLGVAPIGQWNRAEVVTSIPFQQVQGAIAQAVYPELRHFRERPEAARRVWTDMLALTAWLVLPAGAVVAVLAPWAIGLLFGPGWTEAQWMGTLLALAAAVQLLGTVLSQAVESLGRFAWMWAQVLSTLAVLTAAAAAVSITKRLSWAILGTLVAMIVRHAVQVALAARARYVLGRPLLKQYAGAAVTAVVVAMMVAAPSAAGWLGWGKLGWTVSAALLATAVLVGVFHWRRLPPVVVARRYGLFPH